MPLWFILYIFGDIAMVSGPLPYDANECLDRAAVIGREIDASFAALKKGDPRMRVEGRYIYGSGPHWTPNSVLRFVRCGFKNKRGCPRVAPAFDVNKT